MPTVRYTVAEGEVLSEKRSGTRHFYRSDASGSVVSLYDSAQAKTDSFTYWPYGEVRTSSGSTGTRYKFLGAILGRTQFDGSVYFIERVFQPSNARWMTLSPYWPRVISYQFPEAFIDSAPFGSLHQSDPKPVVDYCRKYCADNGYTIRGVCYTGVTRITQLSCKAKKGEKQECQGICRALGKSDRESVGDDQCASRCRGLQVMGCRDFQTTPRLRTLQLIKKGCKCTCQEKTYEVQNWCCCCGGGGEVGSC